MKQPRPYTEDSSKRKPQVVIHHNQYTVGETTGGLSVVFTILCIVDLFGVFPVIALPRSVIACGVYGIPLVLVVFGLQLYTAVLLGRCWLLAKDIEPTIHEKSRFPYAAVAELAFGNYAKQLVTLVIDITVFSAGVPNFIVAAQSLQLFWWKISGGEIGVSYCIWMLVIGVLLCPVMWLGSPKDMKPLAVLSVCIVTSVAVSTWSCIVTDNVSPQWSGDLVHYVPSATDFLIAYGIIAFQFDVHPMLLTIQVDMKDSRRINRAVFGGFVFTGALFATTAALAASRYGLNVENNILQGIPPSVPLYIVALLVTLQLCLSSAVGNSALFQHIEDYLNVPRDFCWQRCLIRSSIVAFAVFLGEAVPRFDLIMGLVGSTLTGPLMFIFPPLIFLKLSYLRLNLRDEISIKHIYATVVSRNSDTENSGSDNQNGVQTPLLNNDSTKTKYRTFSNRKSIDNGYTVKTYDILLALIVVFLGTTATIIATYSSWYDLINAVSFSTPCLLNSTLAARNLLLIETPML